MGALGRCLTGAGCAAGGGRAFVREAYDAGAAAASGALLDMAGEDGRGKRAAGGGWGDNGASLKRVDLALGDAGPPVTSS